MENHIVLGHWMPRSGCVDELHAGFLPILKYARNSRDDIPCFYILTEDKETDDIEVLTISCFKDKEAYQRYISSPEYCQLKASCESNSTLQYPPQVEVLEIGAGFAYRPDQIESASDPFVILASIRYEPGKIDEGVKHWRVVTDFVEDREGDTSTYCFFQSSQDENILHSLERYKNKEYFKEVHCPSESIVTNVKRQKEIRTQGGLSHRFWKQVGNSRLPE